MSWWKYQPLKVNRQTRYDATIKGWPAVIATVGGFLFLLGYAWEEEEGRSAWTVAGMAAGFAIVAFGFYLDGRPPAEPRREGPTRLKAGRTPPRG